MVEIVLINPRFETSYWGMEHALHLCAKFGKRANMPVSALPLLAALTPAEHKITLIDENVEDCSLCQGRHRRRYGNDGTVARLGLPELQTWFCVPRCVSRWFTTVTLAVYNRQPHCSLSRNNKSTGGFAHVP